MLTAVAREGRRGLQKGNTAKPLATIGKRAAGRGEEEPEVKWKGGVGGRKTPLRNLYYE